MQGRRLGRSRWQERYCRAMDQELGLSWDTSPHRGGRRPVSQEGRGRSALGRLECVEWRGGALGCWSPCTACDGVCVGRLGGEHSLIQVVGPPRGACFCGRGVLGGTLVVSVRGVAGDLGDLLLIPRAVMPPSGSPSPRWWWGPGSGCLDLAVLCTGGRVSGLFSQVCGA